MSRDRGRHGQSAETRSTTRRCGITSRPRTSPWRDYPVKSSCKCSRYRREPDHRNELHWRSRPQPINALSRLCVGDQLTVLISPPPPNFLKLGVRQADIPHVLDVIEERPRCGVLIIRRQLLNLSQGLFE